MNEKETIKGMAKLCCWFQNGKCIANPGIDDVCDMSCEYGQACEKLTSEGYRKILKGSVVLSKEEYEKYKKQDLFMKDYTIVEVLENECAKARKETAEKYHKAMRKVIHERDYIEGYAEIGLQEENDELAKQFGVEVE